VKPGLVTDAAVNINAPGHYLHWSVFTISVANLAVVLVMLGIFVLALLAPFPPGRRVEPAGTIDGGPPKEARLKTPTARSWTARLRVAGLRVLPPERLLPETQPSYVASWIYVFGVATLAALAVVIASGVLIALGGVDWWHSNPTGHFFNSLHLWSVELFFAFMVIHLWGKFFMAAWRGRRARTWVTGMLAFLASVVEAFTGYLSQQNFDSQWVATNGKDALNAAGVGGFFNLMNFGQMLLWHVVLMPLVLVAVVAIHVLFVRYRGVVHPFPARRGRDAVGRQVSTDLSPLSASDRRAADRNDWRGPRRDYDIVREAVAATAVVVAATVALAGVLSSPDVPPITLQQWAKANPSDFVGTAATELAGTSLTATYGPPYNNGDAAVQRLGVSWQKLAGVVDRIDPATAFVIEPLVATAGQSSALTAALAQWRAAPPSLRSTWAGAYSNAAGKLTIGDAGEPVVATGSYGPVPELMSAELHLAQSGGLDASLVAQHPFYGTNFTKPLLFLEDGGYYADQAQSQHLQGNQWGVMNETGSYPGQPWLWLYQLWYHLPGFDHSANVDLIAIYLTGAATLLLTLVPFIPGLRDLPRRIPIYRLIWASYYRQAERRGGESP
jgi:Cytochrome b(N-terminal)/b6/petB